MKSLYKDTQDFNETWASIALDIPIPPGKDLAPAVSMTRIFSEGDEKYSRNPITGSFFDLSADGKTLFWDLLSAPRVVVWQLGHTPATNTMLRHLDGLLRLRAEVPDGLSPTDYWHYARTVRGFSERPGFRLAILDTEDAQPLTPPWWLVENSVYVEGDDGRRRHTATKWRSFDAKSHFHHMMSWEITNGVALRHEKKHQMLTLAELFNPKMMHSGFFEAVNHPGRGDRAAVHIALNTDAGHRIPAPATLVEISFDPAKRDTGSMGHLRGAVVEAPTVYDFVILANMPPAKNKMML